MAKSVALGVPQLSNEMQLSIMNKVKTGELSIDDAISQARKNNLELFQQKEQQATQYNFSVHKSNRIRWQKRVLQVDFNTKMVCSIEKGIIKRQLPFAIVKNCHDGAGTRFSISFKGRHDYELDAASMQDKQKIVQLVNQIIHSNIYSQPVDSQEDVYQVPSVPKRLRQGQLLLQKGGMASFKWKRYEAHLHAGQLTLLPWAPKAPDDGDAVPMVSSHSLPIIIHISDGKARVETGHSFDSFILHTHCSMYQFRMPVTDAMATADIQTERDSWVQSIDKLCRKWRKSQSELTYETLQEVRELEPETETETGPGSDSGPGLRQAPEDGALYDTLSPAGPRQATEDGALYDTLPTAGPRQATEDGALYDTLPQPYRPPAGPRQATEDGALYDTLPQPYKPPAGSQQATEDGALYDTLSPAGPRQATEDGTLYDTLPQPRVVVADGEVPATAPASARTFPLPSTPTATATSTPTPTPAPVQNQPCSRVPLSNPPESSPLYSTVQPKAHPIPPPAPVPPPPRRKLFKVPKQRTKAFHWDLVNQDKIDKSFWTCGVSGKVKIDTFRLFEQFRVKVSGNVADSIDSGHHVEIMLNPKIAHNFNIFLKSFPVQPEELQEKLFIINEKDGGLSDEHIASLRRYVPTLEDVEMYKSYKGLTSDLHIVDQYMLAMCNISYLSSRLDLLLTLRELPISMEDLEPLIEQKISMCRQLIGSQSFGCVLEYLLAVGNYLNEHAGKDKAKGFRLSSLTKLTQLRGVDRHITLLHALVEQIMLHEPSLASFPSELAEFDTVPGASIKGLTAEIDVVKNELQKVLQYRKTYKKRNPISQHPRFAKDLKAAIEKYNMDLQQLTKKSEEMRRIYSDILVKFGEAADQDSLELFGFVCQFIAEFKKVHEELSK